MTHISHHNIVQYAELVTNTPFNSVFTANIGLIAAVEKNKCTKNNGKRRISATNANRQNLMMHLTHDPPAMFIFNSVQIE